MRPVYRHRPGAYLTAVLLMPESAAVRKREAAPRGTKGGAAVFTPAAPTKVTGSEGRMTTEAAGASARLTELLAGRNLGPSHADEAGRTVLRLIGGGSLHFRNSSLIETAGVTGGRIARAERIPGRLTLVFSNDHSVVYPLADGPGAVAVLSPDGITLYEE